ncbi:CbtA family protein [Gordonia sp. L191]|uniref:CbtA family protein n=1 Tax=Gordonia sp. L191 TaxID=2982699 RepID=UPI0024BF2D4A|nr:CbtA family protein [Gordonia sp. L191]WHU47768.1 CbtA family protein [Gordonia sp. L191]
MEKKFIGAGLGSGLIAGVMAFVFARLFIEPQVGKAIDYEAGRSAAKEALEAGAAHSHGGGHSHEGGEVFTRTVQENIGAGVGTVVFGLCMGAFFAVGFVLLWSYMRGRYPGTDPRWVAAALGAIGFVAIYATPFFVYPANPPAVGEEDTIGARSSAYLGITVASVVAAIVAVVVVVVWLRPRIGALYSAIVGAVGYLVAATVVALVLPSFDEVPKPLVDGEHVAFPGFPADVLGYFRIYSIANQAILWITLTTVFAVLLGLLSRAGAKSSGRVSQPAHSL